jgi:hypothetical protein
MNLSLIFFFNVLITTDCLQIGISRNLNIGLISDGLIKLCLYVQNDSLFMVWMESDINYLTLSKKQN